MKQPLIGLGARGGTRASWLTRLEYCQLKSILRELLGEDFKENKYYMLQGRLRFFHSVLRLMQYDVSVNLLRRQIGLVKVFIPEANSK